MHVTRSYSNHTYRSSNFEAKNCHLEAQCVLVCKLDLKLSYEISIHPCNLCLFWSWSMHILHLAKGTDLHFYDLLYYSGLSQAVHNCNTWDTTWDTFSEGPRGHIHLPISQTPGHSTGSWHTAYAIGYHYTTQILYHEAQKAQGITCTCHPTGTWRTEDTTTILLKLQTTKLLGPWVYSGADASA